MTQVKTRKKLTATEARNLRTLLLLTVFEPEAIGERIATARKEAGLTQEEMADLIGVSTRSVQGYEIGEVIPYRHMTKIAEVTQRPVPWLLYGEPEPAGDRALVADQLDRIERVLEVLVARLDPDAQEDPAEAEPGSHRRR